MGAEHIADDELLDLARGACKLADSPLLETHLADCAACSALLSTLVDGVRESRDLSGSMLGPYRLDGLIGAGAMGEVYRARDQRLERDVAVKVLSAQFAASPDRVRRLELEARAAAAIAHPNVVTVYDTGTQDGVPFVVSELIAGETVRSVIDRGQLPRARAIDLALQLVRGLAAAHARGVIHRDLKPDNLIVTNDGVLKILDFGLARMTTGTAPDATEPGTLVGTSGYLSPEQARGEPADARSDLFAAGAIIYELLAGRRAFAGATFAERLSSVLRDTPEPLVDPANAIVMRCLDKDPRARFQTANDLGWVLEPMRDPMALPPAPKITVPELRGVSRRVFLGGLAAAGASGAVLARVLMRPPARTSFEPEHRQLTFRHGRVASARFTRDGGSLLYSAAWDDRPLATFTSRLGGGGTRPLELPAGQLLAVSSRGELALSIDHHFVDGFHQRGQLALAPLEGGTPRGLGVEVQHADFTPDGGELAIVRRVDRRFTLELPVGRVLFEAGWISNPRLSPDGETIACCAHDSPFDDRGDLVLVPRTGGRERILAEGWSSIDGVAWSPDGRAVWVTASREGGNNSIYLIGTDGRERAHVTNAGRVRVHDIAGDGRLAVTQVNGRMRMLVRAPGASDEVDLALSDVSMACDISGDGRRILFVEFGDVDTANGAYLRTTDGGPALRLGEGMPFDLADDDRGVLAAPYSEPGLAIFPIPEGQPLRVPVALQHVRWARWCSGRRIVIAGSATGDQPGRIWRRESAGELVPLTEPGIVGPAVMDPTGGRLALVDRDHLLVVDVAGRTPPRVVAGGSTDRLVCGWTADGNAVFVRTKSPPIEIHRIELASGARTFVREIAPQRLGLRGVDSVHVSHDANAYAYSYGQELSRLYTMTLDPDG